MHLSRKLSRCREWAMVTVDDYRVNVSVVLKLKSVCVFVRMQTAHICVFVCVSFSWICVNRLWCKCEWTRSWVNLYGCKRCLSENVPAWVCLLWLLIADQCCLYLDLYGSLLPLQWRLRSVCDFTLSGVPLSNTHRDRHTHYYPCVSPISSDALFFSINALWREAVNQGLRCGVALYSLKPVSFHLIKVQTEERGHDGTPTL